MSRCAVPYATPTGELELASTWTAAQKVPGTDDIAGAMYQALWHVPNLIPVGAEVRFEARLLDSAGTTTIVPMTMTAVAPRQVYEGAITPVGTDDEMLRAGGNADGPVFLLDDTTLSIIPRSDGTVRTLPALFLYTGASTESGSLAGAAGGAHRPRDHHLRLGDPLPPAGAHGGARGRRRPAQPHRHDDEAGCSATPRPARWCCPARPVPQARAGGSHGGAGWFGSPTGGWNRNDLAQPGSIFDSLRDPHLPGGGGTSTDTGSNPLDGGGTGGGVIRLLAPDARVRVDGEIVADGGNGKGTISGGGAGGAIRLTAARLEGAGRIAARGGAGTNFNVTGGGGGGRIAISYQTLEQRLRHSPPSSTLAAASMTGRSPTAPTAAAALERSTSRWSTRRATLRRRDGCCSPTRSSRRVQR